MGKGEMVKKVKKVATESELELYSYVAERASRVSGEILERVVSSPTDKGGIVFVYGPQSAGKTLVLIDLVGELSEVVLRWSLR